MSVIRNQIIGLMRFSYPALGGFSKAAGDPAALMAQLYDPGRMERRFAMFEALALPTLRAQSDQDFIMVFLIGREMPAPWRDRLADGLAGLPWARVVALDPQAHYLATRRAFDRVTAAGVSHVTGFRLDDDDAIDRDFVARMRQRVETLLPATGPDRPLVTGCNRGYFLEQRPGGNVLFEVVEKTPIGLGLAMTTPVGLRDNIFRRNHRHLAQYFNTFTDAGTLSFIRTVHADNDSDPHASGLIEEIGWASAAPEIAARFGLDASRLQEL